MRPLALGSVLRRLVSVKVLQRVPGPARVYLLPYQISQVLATITERLVHGFWVVCTVYQIPRELSRSNFRG